MKWKIYLILPLLSFFFFNTNAQLPDGATAPNWTLTDINGTSHNLYNYLDDGKAVIIDFSATWCGPCWSYHNSHILRDMYNQFGPNAADEIQVFFIEADPSTNTNCLYGTSGCVGGTWGNWVSGTPYPIIDLLTSTVRIQYQVAYYPTLYIVAPNRKTYEVGQASYNTWVNRKNSVLLNANASITHPDCGGTNNGSIDLQPINGYGPLSFSWSNGATTEDISNLAEGTYYVTITDLYGHSVTKGPFELIEPDAIQVNTLAQENVTCNGYGDGIIDVFAQGGSGNYTYTWSNGQTGPSAYNLTPGTYDVSVEDVTGCTKIETFTITEPPILDLSLNAQAENCNSGDGGISAAAFGGTPPYQFDFGFGWTSATQVTQLPAGVYQVTVADGNLCESYQYVDIPAVPGPTANAGNGGTLTCNTNYLILDASGSSGPDDLDFEWYTPDGYIAYGANSENPRIEGAGTYYLTVTTQGTTCTDESYVVIPIDTVSPSASIASPDQLTCSTTTLQLDGTGSSSGPGFVYFWSTPNGHIVSGRQTNQPTIDAPGTYYFEVSNTINGCSKIIQTTVLQTPPVDITLDQSTNVSCNGGNDGMLSVETIAGQAPFTFSWSNGANGAAIEDLTAGTYTVTASDANNCTKELSFTVQQPDIIQGNPTIQHETAYDGNDGNVTLNPVGGQAPFTANWSNGNSGLSQSNLSPGDYAATITDGNNCEQVVNVTINPFNCSLAAASSQSDVTCFGEANGSATVIATGSGNQFTYEWSNGQTTATATNLPAGQYEVSITDDFNCTIIETVTINQPAQLQANTLALENITCFAANDGAITIEAAGGTPGYVYNWSNGASAPALENLSPGIYTLQLVDNNDCMENYEFTIEEPTRLEVAVTSIENVVCANDSTGMVALEIQGGTAGYQVNWSNGATGDVIENLPTGSYTANVTDANGCSSEITTGIEAKDEIAPVIVLNNATIALGMDGTVTLTPEAIDDGTYDNCSEVQLSLDKTVFTCDDLGTAAVEVTAVDESGNQNTGTADITIVDKLAPTVTCPEDMVLTNCPGIVVFDVPEYEDNCTVVSVELINGPESGSAFPLGTTSITFRGTDQSGNFTDCTFEIELINSLETEVEFENISCYGFNDGSIALEVSGGNPGYSYLWDDTNQSITPEITNLAPGSYSCVITDAEGCSRIEYFTIEEPELLIADVDQLIQPTVDQDNGSITVSVSGGTGVYTYEWTKQGDPDFYSTERDLENIGAGVYRLLVTDENGCSVLVEIRVESTVSVKNQHFSKDFSIFPNPSDGRVQILSTGNTGDYEYIISDVAGKQVQNGKISLLSGQSAALDLSSLSEGMYTVRLTNDLEVAILPIQIQKID